MRHIQEISRRPAPAEGILSEVVEMVWAGVEIAVLAPLWIASKVIECWKSGGPCM